ncbi:AI-2E family transporter [Ramlibacter sp.]|uniref:AI-2E family transporter n=1 Tax=Ramlibacter sp. TaxID=1917967 RepID=UPI0025F9F8C7|nr:AI-2E family transporter [Ramlibacter sp.]
MTTPNPLKDPELEFKSLLVLVLGATLLFALIIWPFFGAVCWAVFIAIVFWPLNQRFLRGARGRRSTAALASLIVILVIVILPTALIAGSIADEATLVVGKLRSGEIQIGSYFQKAVEVLPGWARSALDRVGIGDFGTLQRKIIDSAGASGQLLTARAFSIGQNTLDFTVSFFVMLYVLFFLLRDGKSLTQGIARAIPLREDHTHRLLGQFATVVRATVKGNILVALVQGALGGMAFLVLGVSGALLWGAVMALFSLLPAVGAVIVWGPVALYFFFTGAIVKAIGLTLWGAVVIGLVDNILRPVLVGKDTRMPDYLILVATLGGIAVFGLNGFVIGPVIAAVFLVSWDMLASARQER